MKILQAIREKGIRWCIAIAFDRFVPQWLLRIRRFNVYEMDPESVAGLGAENICVQWSESEEETRQVEEFSGPQRSVVDIGAEHMKVCYAKLNGEIAGTFWMAENIFMEDGLRICYRLNEDEVWLFAAHVAKPFRRHGVYSGILGFMLPEIAATGKRKILLSVNPDNIPSRKVHEKYAKRKVGVAIAVRFLNFTFCKVGEGMKTNRSFTWNHRKRPIEIQFPDDS